VIDTETESEYTGDYEYTGRPACTLILFLFLCVCVCVCACARQTNILTSQMLCAAIYTSIDVSEVGEDTRRLLGIPASGDMGSSGTALHKRTP
jgi:hypothetical protein